MDFYTVPGIRVYVSPSMDQLRTRAAWSEAAKLAIRVSIVQLRTRAAWSEAAKLVYVLNLSRSPDSAECPSTRSREWSKGGGWSPGPEKRSFVHRRIRAPYPTVTCAVFFDDLQTLQGRSFGSSVTCASVVVPPARTPATRSGLDSEVFCLRPRRFDF